MKKDDNISGTCPHEGHSPGVNKFWKVWSRLPRTRPRRRVHAFVDVLRRGVCEEVGDEQEDDQRVLDGVHDQQVVAAGLGSVRQRVDLSGDDGSM